MSWKDAQKWEKNWHGQCLNTYGEEMKQLLYANRMGLETYHNGKSPYNFDMGDTTILDIGAGPASLLLKVAGSLVERTVIEPMRMPEWVYERYDDAGIKYAIVSAEDYVVAKVHEGYNKSIIFDEAWIYNCLQHTVDPQQVIRVAQEVAKVIRIFEWIDTPVNIGHLHTLTEENLNMWLGGYGKIETLTGQANCYGRCYYGIFPAEHMNE